ncbi:MAG: cupin, partial [Bacteroidetes bacterium QS_1_65_9]
GSASHSDWDELQSRVYCPECETETAQDTDFVEGRFEMTCTECGTTQG